MGAGVWVAPPATCDMAMVAGLIAASLGLALSVVVGVMSWQDGRRVRLVRKGDGHGKGEG